MLEIFHPVIENLMESGKVSASEYASITVGQLTIYGTIVSKGNLLDAILAESPLYACASRSQANCEKCPLLNKGCRAPFKW